METLQHVRLYMQTSDPTQAILGSMFYTTVWASLENGMWQQWPSSLKF